MDMCCGCGKFALGMATGFVVGMGAGIMIAPDRRKMKRSANKVAKKVGEAVDMLTEAMEF